MKKLHLISFFFFLFCVINAQENSLPKGFSPDEINMMDSYLSSRSLNSGVLTDPPNFSVRTMAEWEEIQTLTIAWQGFEPILTEIVRNAVDECNVIIACDNPSDVNYYLEYYGLETNNVEYLDVSTNSIWMRDYGQNTVYRDDVEEIYLVDWIYNRPRPDDDNFPLELANYMNIDLYQTSESPFDLVATGGNFMSDGFGTAFSSHLILNENDGYGPYNSLNYPDHSESDIDNIMNQFMGIDTYIKMPTLPFDGINHLDMHMKLLDEETLLVSQYPEGVSDGPQIEENLAYILENFTTKWGTPFKVIRIPSPPSTSGAYPGEQDFNPIDGYYRTYTNAVFVNKTVILPFYREEYDTIAQRIYEEALPGYNIVGIDCDNSGNNIISQSGAIHCITHSVGVNDPLLISYKKIEDYCPSPIPYLGFQTLAKHKSGISSVSFNYRYSGESNFSSVNMEAMGDDMYSMVMTFDYSDIEYYVHAISNDGKNQYKPMTALNGGYNSFKYSLDECESIYGCTDENACNFDNSATIDDNSCILPEEFYDCDGNCILAIDCAGECGGTAEDLGCGCGNPAAALGFDCDGNCILVVDCAGACGGDAELDNCSVCDDDPTNDNVSCVLCNDLEACNFDPLATISDGSCIFPLDDCIAGILEGGELIYGTYDDSCMCIYNNSFIDENNNLKKLIKVVDLLGRDVISKSANMVLLFIYDDGTIKKRMIN
ncbi:agmatine deiminase family protein [Flavobacteriales bacterium]|nr:agmatine deiminase family protein [Flavobacteriales bacterium]